MYSKTVMDHFRKPRNVGVIEQADGVGEVGNPLCGDMMTIYLEIKNETIDDIKFQTFGCGAAIAVSSMLTEMAKGKTLDEASKITNKDVAAGPGGASQEQTPLLQPGGRCPAPGHQRLRDQKDGKVPVKPEPLPVLPTHGGEKCYCPYCDTEIPEGEAQCKSCQLQPDISRQPAPRGRSHEHPEPGSPVRESPATRSAGRHDRGATDELRQPIQPAQAR